MSTVERLCADEHEIALRGRFRFGPEDGANRIARLPDRDRFRQTLLALRVACHELGLSVTTDLVDGAVRTLNDDVDVTEAHRAFNKVSEGLKVELGWKMRLVPAE